MQGAEYSPRLLRELRVPSLSFTYSLCDFVPAGGGLTIKPTESCRDHHTQIAHWSVMLPSTQLLMDDVLDTERKMSAQATV